MSGVMQCFGSTHVGRTRPTNQDSYLITDFMLTACHRSASFETGEGVNDAIEARLLVVADGVGGCPAGEVASRLAVQSFARHLLNAVPWTLSMERASDDLIRQALRDAVAHAHSAVTLAGAEDRERLGMATTLTAAFICWPRMWQVHVGDSALFLLRDRELTRLTGEHTIAHQLAEESNLDEETLAKLPYGKMLWNAVGSVEQPPDPEIRSITLAEHDCLLLCTDGLTKYVGPEELAEVMLTESSLDRASRDLISRAIRRGGNDNITLIQCRVSGEEGRCHQKVVQSQTDPFADTVADVRLYIEPCESR